MAVEMLTEYAFEELQLHRIEANVMPRNKASLRVLEKNHFKNEGISKNFGYMIREQEIYGKRKCKEFL